MPFIHEIRTNESRIGVWKIDGTEREQIAQHSDMLGILAVKHPRTQLQRIASRLLLKDMVGEFPRLEKDEFGKPLLPDHDFDISISHTKGYAAVMLGNGHLGVDVQNYKPNVMTVRNRFLDDVELKMAHDLETTTLLWAAKEAIYKFNGRSGLDFKDPITVHYIDSDNIQSSFVYNEKKTELQLGWRKLEEAVLVWTVQ
ncbi:MAG: 4'-phosphopantetheinyl transferase superfamily protein [Flavobacteriales bacterium]|jgi:phosphopantetheinyl transferase|nr:4'-phosphopantetheinyl transferase superfamily protein [Flavobacteriales bacterium]